MTQFIFQPFLMQYRCTLRSLSLVLRTWDVNREKGQLLGEVLNGLMLPNLQEFNVTLMYISSFNVDAIRRLPVAAYCSTFGVDKISLTLEGLYPQYFSWVLNAMKTRARVFEVTYNATMSKFLIPHVECAANLTRLTLTSLERLNVCSVLIRCPSLVYADFHLNKHLQFKHICQGDVDCSRSGCWSNRLRYLSLFAQEDNRETVLEFFERCDYLGGTTNDFSVFLVPKYHSFDIAISFR